MLSHIGKYGSLQTGDLMVVSRPIADQFIVSSSSKPTPRSKLVWLHSRSVAFHWFFTNQQNSETTLAQIWAFYKSPPMQSNLFWKSLFSLVFNTPIRFRAEWCADSDRLQQNTNEKWKTTCRKSVIDHRFPSDLWPGNRQTLDISI